MKRFFTKMYYFWQDKVAPCFVSRKKRELLPDSDDFYVTRLLQEIEPVINDEKMSDKEKIEILKCTVDSYDPLVY